MLVLLRSWGGQGSPGECNVFLLFTPLKVGGEQEDRNRTFLFFMTTRGRRSRGSPCVGVHRSAGREPANFLSGPVAACLQVEASEGHERRTAALPGRLFEPGLRHSHPWLWEGGEALQTVNLTDASPAPHFSNMPHGWICPSLRRNVSDIGTAVPRGCTVFRGSPFLLSKLKTQQLLIHQDKGRASINERGGCRRDRGVPYGANGKREFV